MSIRSCGSMPTDLAISGRRSRPRLTSRMNDRIAASLARTSCTRRTSPAVNSSARYSAGMRSASIAPKRLSASSASWPLSFNASTTGESGGMYQTMGMVRYSGCSGSATS